MPVPPHRISMLASPHSPNGYRYPTSIDANVADPEHRLVAGYDHDVDLAAHYPPAAIATTALTGELPGEDDIAVVDRLSAVLGFTSVRSAAVHAGTIAANLGAAPAAVVAVIAGGLAEEASSAFDRCASAFAMLAATDSDPRGLVIAAAYDAVALELPAAEGPGEAMATALLAEHLERWWGAPTHWRIGETSSPWALALAALWCTGVRERSAVIALWVSARLAIATAEAETHRHGALAFNHVPRFVLPDTTAVRARGDRR